MHVMLCIMKLMCFYLSSEMSTTKRNGLRSLITDEKVDAVNLSISWGTISDIPNLWIPGLTPFFNASALCPRVRRIAIKNT